MKEIDNNDIISAELIGLFTHQNNTEQIFCLKTYHAYCIWLLRHFDNKVLQRREPTQICDCCKNIRCTCRY